MLLLKSVALGLVLVVIGGVFAEERVPAVCEALNRLHLPCRKAGMTPGEMRTFLKQLRLENLEKEISAIDAQIAAWQHDIRE